MILDLWISQGIDTYIPIWYDGYLKWEYHQKWMVYNGKYIYKWMMTGGTPISGNLHIDLTKFGIDGSRNLPNDDSRLTGLKKKKYHRTRSVVGEAGFPETQFGVKLKFQEYLMFRNPVWLKRIINGKSTWKLKTGLQDNPMFVAV